MRHQALLAYSCSQLEILGVAASTRSSVPEILVCPCASSRRGSSSDTTNPQALPSSGVTRDHQCNMAPGLHPVSYARRRCGRDSRDSESLLPLVRSHSEPGLSSSTDTGVCVCVCYFIYPGFLNSQQFTNESLCAHVEAFYFSMFYCTRHGTSQDQV